ncbi:MAG: hypothetical protein LBG42_00850, partial [Treponema sp.]|nr:hypothetical protein [Treponema sp.]
TTPYRAYLVQAETAHSRPPDGVLLVNSAAESVKNGSFLVKNELFLVKNESFLVKNGSFLVKNELFLVKNGSFLVKNGIRSWLTGAPQVTGFVFAGYAAAGLH